MKVIFKIITIMCKSITKTSIIYALSCYTILLTKTLFEMYYFDVAEDTEGGPQRQSGNTLASHI